MGIHNEIGLNRKFVEFAKLLNIYLNHFPKWEKYGLCKSIRNTAYQMYDLIVEGQKRYYKKTTLTDLDITHQKLRMQLFLAYELGYFKSKDGECVNKNPEKLEVCEAFTSKTESWSGRIRNIGGSKVIRSGKIKLDRDLTELEISSLDLW